MRPIDRRSALLAALALPLPACARRADSPRCAQCGMRVAPGSHWAAGALDARGAPLAFDTPACLFRYRASPRGRGARADWVTEYYGPAGRRADARALRYVAGSDVAGPMGPDLVPVEPARVARFRRDHGGHADLGFADVTPEVLAAL